MNFLIPNEQGGYVVRQSDLSAWARCQLQKFYQETAKADPEAPQGKSLSATTFGSVVHRAAMLMMQWHHEGSATALRDAIADFEYYWQPENLAELGLAVDIWIPRQTWAGLLARGKQALTEYFEIQTTADTSLLALEYEFAVPMKLGDRTHTVTGTIDLLEVGKKDRKPYLGVKDVKTGLKPEYLRWNMQFTAYAWASTLPEFWLGWPESGKGELATFDETTVSELERVFKSWGYALHSGSPNADEHRLAARRGTWIDLKNIKFADAGWRTQRDYSRLHLAVEAYIASCEVEIYSVNLTGSTCQYCSFRDTCAGVGLDLDEERDGAP